MLATSLLVVHDTGGGSQDDETELTRGEQLDNPLLEVTELNVVTGVDDTGLVQAVNSSEIAQWQNPCRNLPAVKLDDDLAGAVVVNLLELANVA